MGWLWFIPTFHMSQPPSMTHPPTKLVLTRKELDFPLGVGEGILDVEITLEWRPAKTVVQLPSVQSNGNSKEEVNEVVTPLPDAL